MAGGHSGDSSDSGAERRGSSPEQLPEVKKTRTGEHWSEESSKNCSESSAGEDWGEESIKEDVESEEERDDEDDEENESDGGEDEDDEENESDGKEDEEHAEESYGLEKSDADEEDDAGEDYYTREVYFEKDHESISWQSVGNDILLQTFGDGLFLKAAAIVSSNGSYLYCTPAFPQVSSKEMDVIWRVIELTGNSKIYFGGHTFLMVRVEPSLVHGKKEDGVGLAIMRSHNALVFGLYEEPVTQLQCIGVVRDMVRELMVLGV